MKKELKDKWIAALRSGEYKQSPNVLYNGDDNTYCCLGVLCAIQQTFEWERGWEAYSIPPEKYRNGLNELQMGQLVNLNDIIKMPFDLIADWIETNIPAE